MGVLRHQLAEAHAALFCGIGRSGVVSRVLGERDLRANKLIATSAVTTASLKTDMNGHGTEIVQDYDNSPNLFKRIKQNSSDKEKEMDASAVNSRGHANSIEDGSLKASKDKANGGVCIKICLAILLVFAIFVSLVALALTLAFYTKTNTKIQNIKENLTYSVNNNNTVFIVLRNDQNLSNNSLRFEIELDEILSAQEDLRRQLRGLEAMARAFEAHTRRNISQLEENTDRNISQLGAYTRRNVSQLEEDTRRNISQLEDNTDRIISQLGAYTRRNVSQLEEDTRRNISQLEDNTDRIISRLEEHTWRNISQLEEDTWRNISQLQAGSGHNTRLLANISEQLFSVTDDHGEQLTVISSVLRNFSNQLAQIRSSVQRLRSDQNAQQNNIAFLRHNLFTLTSNVSKNRESISEQGERLSRFDGRVSLVEQTNSMLSSDVNNLENRVLLLENIGEATHPLNLFTILFPSFIAYIIVIDF